jgi:phosphopantothenoylcysteine decarboxylase/phosphopantothenate--cysteine ligase
MACGEFGLGRMAEPIEILAAIREKLSTGPLAGKHVLVTSGSTQEPLDPVRYISNYSSGKQGGAIAKALVSQGAKVTFISGPSSAEIPKGVLAIRIRTADEMLEAVKKSLPADIAIMAAAVSDWKPINISERKVKKNDSYLSELRYDQNVDILKYVSTLALGRPGLVVGFAAETENLLENGSEKLSNKGCDWILANDVSPNMEVFGGEENTITFISRNNSSNWPRMTKELVAQKLVNLIIEELC